MERLQKISLIKIIIYFFVLMTSNFSLAAPPESSFLMGRIEGLTNGEVSFVQDQEQIVRFMTTSNGRFIEQPYNGVFSNTPEKAAINFLKEYAAMFGGNYKPEYSVLSSSESDKGYVVKLRQSLQGVPVYAGEMVVRMDNSFQVVGVNGEVSSNLSKVSAKPLLNSDEAEAIALSLVEKSYKVEALFLQTDLLGLWVYNPKLIGETGDSNTLVWLVEVTGNQSGNVIRESIMVDAQSGAVSLSFSKIMHAKERLIYDSENLPNNNLPGSNLVRVEGDAGGVNNEIDSAYDFSGDTYDFYLSYHGRDSLDDAGMSLISTVRFCPIGESCPYQNAFWNGYQMTYGEGFAVDDVVAHELTHGVTEFTSGLIYLNQSGAINESLSDIWGEFVDLTNSAGTDTKSVRWKMGEDIPGIGAIRDMEDPSLFGDPDKMTSSNYYCGSSDNGGVHTNSGVGNKAAYLMADGGSFNGMSVTKIGIRKTAKIYYRAQTSYLTSGSSYQDLYEALKSSCNDLIGTSNITADNCESVQKALDAVEMSVIPCGTVEPVPAPFCPAGLSPKYLMNDDLEQGLSLWTHTADSGDDAWKIDNTNPYEGFQHIHGDDFNDVSDSSIEMKRAVTLTSNSFLRFEHSVNTELLWDGGVVEYSIDDGLTWQDGGPLISENGYSGVLYPSGNPLAGRDTFTGNSSGYISSRLNLSPLRGKLVKFRFRMGTDGSVGAYGWDIDNVQVYDCEVTSGPVIVSPVPGAKFTGFKRIFKWDNKQFNVTKSWLMIGTSENGSDIARINTRRNTEVLVSGLPKDGSIIYVTLRTFYDDRWHAYKTTYVSSSKGFIEHFNGDISRWNPLSGRWVNKTGKYLFNRPDETQSVLYTSAVFSDFDYAVKAKSIGGNSDEADVALVIRADGKVSLGGGCNNCYTFDVAKIEGVSYFSVWKVTNSTPSALQYWAESEVIKDSDWNVLRVKTNGASMRFYINGVVVWSGIDTTHSSGFVGLESYGTSSSAETHLLYADWAKLTAINSLTFGLAEPSSKQLELNQRAENRVNSKFNRFSKWGN